MYHQECPAMQLVQVLSSIWCEHDDTNYYICVSQRVISKSYHSNIFINSEMYVAKQIQTTFKQCGASEMFFSIDCCC